MKRATFAILLLLFITAYPLYMAADISPPVEVELCIDLDQECEVMIIQTETITLPDNYMLVVMYWEYMCQNDQFNKYQLNKSDSWYSSLNITKTGEHSPGNLKNFLGPGDIHYSSEYKI